MREVDVTLNTGGGKVNIGMMGTARLVVENPKGEPVEILLRNILYSPGMDINLLLGLRFYQAGGFIHRNGTLINPEGKHLVKLDVPSHGFYIPIRIADIPKSATPDTLYYALVSSSEKATIDYNANRLKRKSKRIQLDNGINVQVAIYEKYYRDEGIRLRASPPYRYEQNGRIERMVRRIIVKIPNVHFYEYIIDDEKQYYQSWPKGTWRKTKAITVTTDNDDVVVTAEEEITNPKNTDSNPVSFYSMTAPSGNIVNVFTSIKRPDSDSPSVRPGGVEIKKKRIALALAVQESRSVRQLDVVAAYLYGLLHYEVFLDINDLWHTFFDRYPDLADGVKYEKGRVICLQRALYGLKQGAYQASWKNKGYLSFAVGQQVRAMSTPIEDHHRGTKRIMRYLANKGDYGVRYRKTKVGGVDEDVIDVDVYTDSSFIDDPVNRKSTYGYVTVMADGPVA
ncbi:Reverse transcriptase, RNA-dependent DNA polymerase [Niveomyces insectorum RCEF 264]|uniref:Reverse transcriptase, RNA-dependent DNA polymerase n=1 Tax=Niveomyces insectorum RCEF 264 TaxID=1081102 RepID=A0A167RT57_9HYPO|nr:Reverse transcriptase, RNA-dependent DNA polymerase [Niveomyces insectorum RCEF 264]